MKLFYTRFDGRAQNTNAKISSYFSKFLRFYYERLYFRYSKRLARSVLIQTLNCFDLDRLLT